MKQRPQTFFEATEELNKAGTELFHAFFDPWLLPSLQWLNKQCRKVETMDKRKIIPVLALSLAGAVAGLVVTLGTFVLVGLQAKHLPGGSLAAGLTVGMWAPRENVPRLVFYLIGGTAGLIGWGIGTLFL